MAGKVCCIVALVASTSLSAAPPSPASRPGDGETARRWNEESGLRGAMGLESLTPAELKTYCASVADVNGRRLRQELNITPDQEAAVQKRLNELVDECAAYLVQHQPEMRAAAEEAEKVRSSRGQVRPDMQVMMKRGNVMLNLPLHTARVTPEIEKLLPPEQVKAAHIRRYLRSPSLFAGTYQDRYQLTAEQKQKVEQRLQECQKANEAYWETNWIKADELQAKMRAGSQGAPVNPAQRREVSEQYSQLMQAQPCSPRKLIDEIEAMLPPEQVKAAKDRLGRGGMEGLTSEEMNLEMARRLEERARASAASQPSRLQSLRNMEGARLISWDIYVREFTRTYGLNSDQQGTAQSILREAKQRRSEYETEHRTEFMALRNLDDRDQRLAKLKAYNKPVDVMFQQLKEKLEAIPTAAQREKAEAEPRGVIPGSRPAGTSTRPTEDDKVGK